MTFVEIEGVAVFCLGRFETVVTFPLNQTARSIWEPFPVGTGSSTVCISACEAITFTIYGLIVTRLRKVPLFFCLARHAPDLRPVPLSIGYAGVYY